MQINRYIYAFVFLLLLPIMAKAQFTVVDADSKAPLPGVYVFSDNGKLITMSNEKGKVKAVEGNITLSLMSYESLTAQASKLHGEVALKPKPLNLEEVVIGKTEYVKLSAAFRDVLTNFDKVTLYREGIVDYYYSSKTKKWTSRVRGCRQYEHPELRHPWADSVACWGLQLLDFNKVRLLKRTDSETVHGDTTVVGAMHGKTEVKDGIMVIKTPGNYRTIIDHMKFVDRTSVGVLGLKYEMKKKFFDWNYSESGSEIEKLKLVRTYTEEDFQWSKKKGVVPIVIQSDVAVYDISYPTKEEAKAEMKDKKISVDFILPDCLPAIPPTLIEQGKQLVQKSFHDF